MLVKFLHLHLDLAYIKTLTVPSYLLDPDIPSDCPIQTIVRHTSWPQSFPETGNMSFPDAMATVHRCLPTLLPDGLCITRTANCCVIFDNFVH